MRPRVAHFALVFPLAITLTSNPVNAQQVISAQSGTVHYVEGTVYADGQKVARKFGQFPALKQGGELRTEDGRAEMLLTPGAFLRVAENSSVRMLDNQLSNTRVEVVSGSVMVECDELLPDNALTLVYHGDNISLSKKGLYRLDAGSGEFQVYDGQAVVGSGADALTLKRGKETSLNGRPQVKGFDIKVADDFLAWNRERSSLLAYASVSAGQSQRTSGNSWLAGGWGWSPLFDEFTYLPGRGILYSPFGWEFWSPYQLGYYGYVPAYYVQPYFGAGSGTNRGSFASGSAPSTNNGPARGKPTPGNPGIAGRPTTGFIGGNRGSAIGSQPAGGRSFPSASPGVRFGGGGAPASSGGRFGGGAAASAGGGFGGGAAASAGRASGGAISGGSARGR